jgi:hypothetical protein
MKQKASFCLHFFTNADDDNDDKYEYELLCDEDGNDVFFGVEEEEDSTRREEEQRPAAKLSQISCCESRESFKHGERQHFQRRHHRQKSKEF